MSKDLSPEERLLRLIRSKTPKEIDETAPAALPAPVPPPTPAPRKFSFDFSGFFKQESLNLALIVMLAALTIVFIPVFLKSPKIPAETLEDKIKVHKKAAAREEEPQRPSFDYYSGQAGSRNIFAPAAAEDTKAQAAGVEQGPKLEEVKGQLSLLGVIGGAAPQVIIEDKRTQKTYFLNKGSTFGDIEVGDISENKVILTYKGKQFELVL